MTAGVLIASAALFLGCGPGVEWHVDDAFTPEERAALVAATDDMAQRTGGDRIVLVFDGNVSHGTQRFVRVAPPPEDDGAELDGHFLYEPHDERAIYLRPGMPPARFYNVARHEVGHSYGLIHHKEPGLMNAHASGEWSAADVAVCRHVGLCGDGK